jgi:hypothetical protein
MNHLGEGLPPAHVPNPESIPQGPTDIGLIAGAVHKAVQAAKTAETLQRVHPSLSDQVVGNSIKRYESDLEADGVPAACGLLRQYGVEVVSTGPDAPRHIAITHDSKAISFGNGEVVPLGRNLKRMKAASYSLRETEGEALRLDVLKTLGAHPGEAFSRKELWDKVRPDMEYERKLWEAYIQPLIDGPHVHQGEPLIHDIKINSRASVFAFGNFIPNFVPSLRPLRLENEPNFTLDYGRRVPGKNAILLHMLEAATADKPVTNDDWVANYTPQELAKINLKPRQLLPLTVTGITAHYLKDADTEFVIWRVKTDQKDPETGYRQSGYYMEKRLSLAEAGSVCHFLWSHKALLAEQGLTPPSKKITEALREGILESDRPLQTLSSAELTEQRRQSFEKTVRMLTYPKHLKKFIELVGSRDPNDPRLAMLGYFRDLLRTEGAEQAIRQILDGDYPKKSHRFKLTKKNGMEHLG